MSWISHILLLLILLAFPLDSQIISSRFYFDYTSAVSLTLHFIHNQFAHLQISLHFTYLIQKPTHGAPTLHQFYKQIVPYPSQPYHIGAPISVFVHLSQIILYLLYKRLCFQQLHHLFVFTFGDLLPFLENATHVTLGWGTLYHQPLLTSSIYSEYPTGHLPLPFEFIHSVPPLAQLIPYLFVPLTLDLVVIHKFGRHDDVMMMVNLGSSLELFPEKSYLCLFPEITFLREVRRLSIYLPARMHDSRRLP